MRKTKIICTIGPATDGLYEELITTGMDAARFNFSHGDHESHGRRISELKKARGNLGIPIPLVLDTKGPEMRIGVLKEKATLINGHEIILTVKDIESNAKVVSISNKTLYEKVDVGQSIFIDDGSINLEVLEIVDKDIKCKVVSGGVLSSRKGVNVPGCDTGLPFMSEQDLKDIEFGIDMDFDFIALSFIHSAKDIFTVKEILKRKHSEDTKIIAKIENSEAVKNIDEIIAAADSIMIARGDLGIELPVSTVPIIQKQLIKKCYSCSKPVIVATQMLESMTENPIPTRAEVSDVANAIFDGTSVVMLSGETAAGMFPVETLQMMTQVINEAETSIDYRARFDSNKLQSADNNILNTISEASVITSFKINAKAIIVPTRSGNSARMIPSFRPSCPIIAISMDNTIQRQLNISWGIKPMLNKFITDQKELFEKAMEKAIETDLVENGDMVILTAGIPTGSEGTTNMLKLHKIGDEVIGN